ncbi:MAG: UDP-N-acetylmuramoyl-L-alanine--D-glutamate ligase [Parcubacteria group bacterium]|jgi:UDP-N-acetylmuramoylalanine--D-glutamate ligase
MERNDFKGKKITVLGLGLHGGGVGIIRFLSEAGARLTVTDLKSEEELQPSLEKLADIEGVEYVLGRHCEDDFATADMVVKNPGVPWTNSYIQLALEKGVAVEIDSSLFFKLCKNKIIGVTGTRGKTTTASLIYEILRAAGKNPIKVGIGQVSVLDKLNDVKDDAIVVFELSSWRLSALGRYGLSPEIAVLTNVFQDHLNYYRDMEEYLADKKYIYSSQKTTDFCVVNWDDERLMGLDSGIGSQVIGFSQHSLDQDRAVYVEQGAIYSRHEGNMEKIIDLAEIKIKGAHNISNILASVGVAQALHIDAQTIRKGILAFTGLPHRLEFVRELDGVKYYNDTAATSPDGAISGIQSFTESIVLISGGSDKNLVMTELAQVIKEKIQKIVFLQGAGTDKIISALRAGGRNEEFQVVDSMDAAVARAKEIAVSGEVILLSPGTASFGLFLNEFDRGDKFKKIVKELS